MQDSELGLEVLPLGSDQDAYISIVGESLLNYGDAFWGTYLDRVGHENARSIRRGGRCVGGLAFYRMGHWFGGRPIATVGISGVAISPQERGTGTCRYLVESALREAYDNGFPLASLYASTQTLYRKVGFEIAGTQTLYSLPMPSIASGHDRSCPVDRIESPSIPMLEKIAQIRAQAGNGQLQRTEGLWQRLLKPNDGLSTKTYLFGQLENPEGYLILKANQSGLGVLQPLVATDLVVHTERALHRLLAMVRDHRSIFNSFQWWGAPNDPLLLFADEGRTSVVQQTRWMERILNVPEALSGRGYPPEVDVTLDLEINDPFISENTGRWRARISAGRAQVCRGGNGMLAMNIGTLATLFTSFLSAAQLAQLGRIRTDRWNQISDADRAFSGPAPWMPELF